MKHIGVKTALFSSLIILVVSILFIDLNHQAILCLFFINQAAFLGMGIMYDQTKVKAERDQLTNLYNRFFILRKLPKLIKQNSSLSVCVVDIDDFKNINDTFGHHVGDQVIKQIAHILDSETRKNDLVVRWGGDEFLIIAPNLNPTFLTSLNERINQRLEKVSMQYNLPISVTIGISSSFQEKNIEAIIHLADENMYKRKREKLNQLQTQC